MSPLKNLSVEKTGWMKMGGAIPQAPRPSISFSREAKYENKRDTLLARVSLFIKLA